MATAHPKVTPLIQSSIAALMAIATAGCGAEDGFGRSTRVEEIGSVPQGFTTTLAQGDRVPVTTQSRSDWTQVTFNQPFAAPPIVVVGPPTSNGNQPAVVRAKDVTATGFKVQIREWNYLDGSHSEEYVSYLAVVPGIQNWGGLQVAAGPLTVNDAWTEITPMVANPIALATQVTNNGSDTTTIRIKSEAGKVKFRLQEQESLSGAHTDETLHVILFQRTTGTLSGLPVSAYSEYFDDAWGSPNEFAGLAQMQTTNGADPAGLRIDMPFPCQNILCPFYGPLRVQEEQSADSETDHNTEEVGFVKIGFSL